VSGLLTSQPEKAVWKRHLILLKRQWWLA